MAKKYPKKEKIYEYTVVFEPAEEGGYVVDVPAIPGCHTQGDSLREARKNAIEAIQCFLEYWIEEEKPIPKEPKEMIEKIRIPMRA